MATCRFKVTSISAEPDIRGREMRRIKLAAVDSEPFEPTKTAAGKPQAQPASPDGAVSMLVSVAFAKTLDIGDEMALEKRP